MGNIGEVILGLLITAGILFAIFLITREFWCWFFKINATDKILISILNELREANGKKDKQIKAISELK